MGKFMRKSKTAGEVSLVEITHAESSRGVLTRAKALALQRLRKSSLTVEPPHPPPTVSCGSSYIQLRSRRLEKSPNHVVKCETKRVKRQRYLQKQSISRNLNPNPGTRSNSRLSSTLKAAASSLNYSGDERGYFDSGDRVITVRENILEINYEDKSGSGGPEASSGLNVLKSEGRDRITLKTSPCISISDPDFSESGSRAKNSMQRSIPSVNDMDKFFADAEEQQQKQFIEKYNFDPVKEKPLPGRYEWVKMDSSQH